MDFMHVGFRFHPTDEELVDHYLKNKLLGNDSMVNKVIAEIDVCKFEPWKLPGLSLIKSKDPEWFFFCPRDYKYAKSKRLNRATNFGFWKATGNDRYIKKRGTNNVIGSKKTLVFYTGPVPGVKTNWVIHEYHAVTFRESERTFVLCRLIKQQPEKKAKGGTDTLSCDKGEPIVDVVDSLPKINIESTFEAPPRHFDQSFFPHSTKQIGSCTNSPFLGAYFNKEKNNMQIQLDTIQEENESVDSFKYFRDENITFQSPFETPQQENELVNPFFVGFGFGINGEERELASVNGPSESEVASALCGNTLNGSTIPNEHPSTSVLSSNKDKMDSVFQYDDIMGMGTSSCESTAEKPLEMNCNEILSSLPQHHPRPQTTARRRSQRPRKVSKHMGWPKIL